MTAKERLAMGRLFGSRNVLWAKYVAIIGKWPVTQEDHYMIAVYAMRQWVNPSSVPATLFGVRISAVDGVIVP